jgi:hypothetical protein
MPRDGAITFRDIAGKLTVPLATSVDVPASTALIG